MFYLLILYLQKLCCLACRLLEWYNRDIRRTNFIPLALAKTSSTIIGKWLFLFLFLAFVSVDSYMWISDILKAELSKSILLIIILIVWGIMIIFVCFPWCCNLCKFYLKVFRYHVWVTSISLLNLIIFIKH